MGRTGTINKDGEFILDDDNFDGEMAAPTTVPEDIEIDKVYGIVSAMRRAKDKYCTDNNIEGSFYCADITVYEMDMSFIQALRKVEDYERGYNRFWKSLNDK